AAAPQTLRTQRTQRTQRQYMKTCGRSQSRRALPFVPFVPLCPLRFHQNLTRSVLCTFRIGFASVGRPNCGLNTIAFTLAYVTRLSTLVALMRQSSVSRSPQRKERPSPASNENCRGPVIE